MNDSPSPTASFTVHVAHGAPVFTAGQADASDAGMMSAAHAIIRTSKSRTAL